MAHEASPKGGTLFRPIAVLNLDLCDCFLEYGVTTVEAPMLLTFVLFGAGTRIPGSVRVAPDQVQDWAMRYLAEHPDSEPHLPSITTYCT
jgi:hypothetical protein